jgi:hypothetical protein
MKKQKCSYCKKAAEFYSYENPKLKFCKDHAATYLLSGSKESFLPRILPKKKLSP